jgi:hypothetical protein
LEEGGTLFVSAAGAKDGVGGLEDPLRRVFGQRLAGAVPGLDVAAGVVGAGKPECLEAEKGDRLGFRLGEGLREVRAIGPALGGVIQKDVAVMPCAA